jgi:hypothetical protein
MVFFRRYGLYKDDLLPCASESVPFCNSKV